MVNIQIKESLKHINEHLLLKNMVISPKLMEYARKNAINCSNEVLIK